MIKTKLLAIYLLLTVSFHALAQEKETLFQDETITIKLMTLKLAHSIAADPAHDLKYFVFFTNRCGGTPGVIKHVNELKEKYPKEIEIIMVSSVPLQKMPGLIDTLKAHHYSGLCYMLTKPFKDDRDDDREKATKFRNKLCEECRDDIIGVPYKLIYDKTGKILVHGYPGFRGPYENLPSDYITYFLEKSKAN